MSTPLPIIKLLKKGKIFTFQKKIQTLDLINEQIFAFLPYPLRDHCCAGDFSDGTLVLHTSSSAWLTLLRYQIPELKNFLIQQQVTKDLSRIRAKIALPLHHNK